jgi:AraC family transcriptional regulator, transcriptional activator FtrA
MPPSTNRHRTAPAAGRHRSRAARAAILALPHAVPFEVSAVCQILGAELPDGSAPYQISVCGERLGLVAAGGGFVLRVDGGLAVLAGADLVVVPGTLPVDPVLGPQVFEALRAAHARGVPLVAIGTAAFVLARSGLLDGRRATTHWAHAAELARRYPRVRVDPGVLAVEDGGICTSAGVTTAIDLCLDLVRRHRGPAIANEAARQAVVTGHRSADQAQLTDRPVPAGTGSGLAEVRTWMRNHLDEHMTLDQLANRAFMSRRQFTRMFRAEAGVSPWQWLLTQRLTEARRLLELTGEQVESIARRCGFATPVAFRTKFKQVVGVPPSRYRERMRDLPHWATRRSSWDSATGS